MDWRDAVEAEVAATGHPRYRELCADAHPDHEVWRARVLARRTGQPMPSLAKQAANLAAAAGRAFWAGLQGEAVVAAPEEVSRRLVICRGCEHWRDARCALCGCFTEAKARLATERCPAGKW